MEERILVWMGEGNKFEVRGSKFEVSRCGRRDVFFNRNKGRGNNFGLDGEEIGSKFEVRSSKF